MDKINSENCPFEPYIAQQEPRIMVIGDLSPLLMIGVLSKPKRIVFNITVNETEIFWHLEPEHAELIIGWLQEAINTVRGWLQEAINTVRGE